MRKHRNLDSNLVEVSRPTKVGETEFNGARIIRMPNGDIEVGSGDDGPRIPKEGDHDENLAEYLSDSQRQNIAQELIELLDADEESRRDWEMREETAVEMLGIERHVDSPDQPKKLEYPTAKNHEVTHPLFAEAATQFNARAIAEVFPPEGPIRVTTLGKNRSRQLIDQADRVQTFMNYYLTEVDREYFDDVDSMLFYLSLMGSAFKKVAIDVRTGLPTSRYIKAANFIVPYTARSLRTAARYHIKSMMVEGDFQKAIDIGYFIDQSLKISGRIGAKGSNKAEDRADLRQQSIPRDENVYEMIESNAFWKLPLKYRRNRYDRNEIRPYVFYVDRENVDLVRVSRAWMKDDNNYRRQDSAVHYKFLPGLGFYGFGYMHLIGSLGRAASGAVNALLDGATASNFQGGFKTKSARGTGEVALEHGVWKEVDCDAEDLTKAFFNPPFKGPEPAMFQLLAGLVESGRRFASTMDAQVGAGDNKGPVGTTVALIEEGSRVYTAIHKRVHKSNRDEYAILARLIHDYMPNEYPYETKGEERTLLRSDFDGRVDIAPVSDPNIFSSTQRLAIAQNVIALQAQAPNLYAPKQQIAAHRMFLQSMRVPDWEEYAPEEKRPNYQDPAAENQLLLNAQAVKAYPHQLHEIHIAVHQNFLQIMQGQMDPKEFAQLQAVCSAHVREHQAMAYRGELERRLGIPLPPVSLDGENEDLPPDIEAAITVMLAQHMLPPPPNPEDEAATQEVMDEKARKDAETIAKIERETAQWEADQERAEDEHQLELRRQEELHEQQLRHAEDEHNAGLIQQRSELAADLLRGDITTMADLSRKGAAAEQDLQFRGRKGQQELEQRGRAGQQDLQHRGRTANLELATKAGRARLDQDIAGARAQQDLGNRARGAALDRDIKGTAAQQDMALRERSAQQERRQTAAKGQQERAQSREAHRENLRQTTEKSTAEMRLMEKRGSQDLKSRERRAALDEKIAKKRAMGTGGAKKKAKRKE